MTEKSNGWERFEVKDGLMGYQKTFPDGLSVVVSIFKESDRYKLVSESETRTSGPVSVTKGIYDSPDIASQHIKGFMNELDRLHEKEVEIDWKGWRMKGDETNS